ncbi:hypothetical protein GCM10010170_020610 [Dactylosporangium salmoneum]|uniref:Uncharacterized protein n=1 Tax=Dactylosporangium salmoneum TaxID=53361 RepID=A0ABN3FVT5_9ACTN
MLAPVAVLLLGHADLGQTWFEVWGWVIGLAGVSTLLFGTVMYMEDDASDSPGPWAAIGTVLAAGLLVMLATGPASVEASTWTWVPATVQETRCPRGDDGGRCDPPYHLTAVATEQDLGWLGCSGTDETAPAYRPGDTVRVHVSPSGARMKIEPCAATSRWKYAAWFWSLTGLFGVALAWVAGTTVARRRGIRGRLGEWLVR